MADCAECGYSPYSLDRNHLGPRRDVDLIWQCSTCKGSKVIEPIDNYRRGRPGPVFWGNLASLSVILVAVIELFAHTL